MNLASVLQPPNVTKVKVTIKRGRKLGWPSQLLLIQKKKGYELVPTNNEKYLLWNVSLILLLALQMRSSFLPSSLGLLEKVLEEKTLPQIIVQLGPSNKELSSPFSKGSLILCFFLFCYVVGLASQSLST